VVLLHAPFIDLQIAHLFYTPSMTPQELESVLVKVRWEQDQMSLAQLSEHLKTIGEYPNYLLVLADGKIPAAPDNKNRFLVPVFTNPEARDSFLEWLPKDRVQQQIYVSEGGFSLFECLAARSIDGIVFNCLSQQPIAFVPDLCQRVLEQQSKQILEQQDKHLLEQQHGTPTDTIDDLMQAAFPKIGEGGFAELDRLFLHLFALPEWFFAVRPENPQTPAIIFHERRQRVFAFTSSQRTITFAKANGLVDADGEVFLLSMPTREALSWLEENQNIEMLHINFGGHGCFIPVANLPLIRQRLGVP
jgi:hypothetical protein